MRLDDFKRRQLLVSKERRYNILIFSFFVISTAFRKKSLDAHVGKKMATKKVKQVMKPLKC